MKKLASYFSFTGRTSRLGYWRAQVWLGLLSAFIWCGGLLLTEFTGVTIYGKAALAALLPILWLAAALLFRRLHDRNKSGWWSLILYVAPLFMAVVLNQPPDWSKASLAILALVFLVFWLWGFIEIGFLRGTRGKNRFGAEPSAA